MEMKKGRKEEMKEGGKVCSCRTEDVPEASVRSLCRTWLWDAAFKSSFVINKAESLQPKAQTSKVENRNSISC